MGVLTQVLDSKDSRGRKLVHRLELVDRPKCFGVGGRLQVVTHSRIGFTS